MPPRKRKKELDRDATLARYGERLRTIPLETFQPLAGAWISTFEIYSTAEEVGEGDALDCFGAVLLRYARSLGIDVKGITSERKSKDRYICHTLGGRQREQERTVYCGKYSYFSGHEKSPFAPCKADYVYIQEDEC